MARTRRNFSAEFKTKVVLEIISGSKTTAEICREYNLKPDLVSHWKNQFLANAAQVFESETKVDPQQARVEELERLAGKLSLELEVAKKARSIYRTTRIIMTPTNRLGGSWRRFTCTSVYIHLSAT